MGRKSFFISGEKSFEPIEDSESIDRRFLWIDYEEDFQVRIDEDKLSGCVSKCNKLHGDMGICKDDLGYGDCGWVGGSNYTYTGYIKTFRAMSDFSQSWNLVDRRKAIIFPEAVYYQG